jgi:hypothetical protein
MEAYAQPSFRFPFINDAPANATVNMPLRVFNFSKVVSMQFVMRWNPATMRFQSIDAYNLNCLSAANFNTLEAIDSGRVRFQWECNSTSSGVTVPDSTPIFRLRLKCIAPDSSNSPVLIKSEPPTYLEVNYIQNGVTKTDTAPAITQGFIAIGYTVDTEDNISPVFETARIFPNPADGDNLQLDFALKQAALVQVRIVDLRGRQVYAVSEQMPSGPGQLRLPSPPESGYWYVVLQSGTQTLTLPFIRF